MRKLYLVVASITLVAFMGFSASAFGLADPRCEADGNPIETLDFSLDTPGSHQPYVPALVNGSAYACGSDIDNGFVGAGTLYNHADIGVPEGVDIADSDLVPNGSWAANAIVNVLYHDPFSLAHFDGGVPSQVTTDSKAACQNELDNEIVGATPGNEPGSEIVTCLKGENPSGVNWSWAVRDASGKLWLTIGPMHGPFGIEPGLTYVNLQLCAYYGAVGSTDCGSEGDQFQQKNGCRRGVYTVTATMENGTVTPVSEDSVGWESFTTVKSPSGMALALKRSTFCRSSARGLQL